MTKEKVIDIRLSKNQSENKKILSLECSKCTDYNNKKYKCFECIFKNLKFKNYKKIEKIQLISRINNVTIEDSEIFYEYLNSLPLIYKLISKIQKIIIKCPYDSINCKRISQKLSRFQFKEELSIYNPFKQYEVLNEIQNKFEKVIFNTNCLSCRQKIIKSIKKIRNLLDNLKLIREYKFFVEKSILKSQDLSFFQYLFSISPKTIKINDIIFNIDKPPLDEYNISEMKLFNVKVYEAAFCSEKIYKINSFFYSDIKKGYYENILEFLNKNLKIIHLNQIIELQEIIEIYQKQAIIIIERNFELPVKDKERISFYASLQKINLTRIFSLLMDDLVEEIFLDSPQDSIYLNHRKYGRCRTEIYLTHKEIDRIITLIRLYSGKRLDKINPNIKIVLNNRFFHCRVSIDSFPLTVSDFALDIRKLNKDFFTIQDLLKNETINSEIASFLFFCILNRQNITCTGQTDSGKTTFINTLDLMLPKDLRKIYIENVTESLNQMSLKKHQLRYQVNSLDLDIENKFTKSNQIKNLLHKSPDIIYLGEILTKEEAEAMFHCLSVGLKGFQTIHSSNIQTLVNRILHHFKIDIACLGDLDIVILMKKLASNKRKLISINEILIKDYDKLIIHPIIKYDPANRNWKRIKPLKNTEVLKNIRNYYYIDDLKFDAIIESLEKFFNHIKKIKKISNDKINELFEKISFYYREKNDVFNNLLESLIKNFN